MHVAERTALHSFLFGKQRCCLSGPIAPGFSPGRQTAGGSEGHLLTASAGALSLSLQRIRDVCDSRQAHTGSHFPVPALLAEILASPEKGPWRWKAAIVPWKAVRTQPSLGLRQREEQKH